ncbi:hypothetical protein DFH06DRAFT_580505 [Mycena polygramma]|nr:hypothetical protein DFH06DRAFT_580505 [Mycena polygramma]
MLSATDLLAHIEELSSAIDVQKEVLKNLNAKRIDAWRSLNALRDPISRLPLELSSEIFVCCLPDSPGPDSGSAPTLLLGVCHRWSSIAISTPSLWNTVYSDCPLDAPNFDKLLEIWLGRAQSLPLSLHLLGPGGSLDHVLPVMMQRASRVEDLELSLKNGLDFEEMNTQSNFSSLKKMRIVIRRTMSTAMNARESLEMLRAAPRLSWCEFEGMYYRRNDTQPPELLIHPSLQHLYFGRPLQESDDLFGWSSTYILQYLTLPALRTLRITELDINRDQFTSFLVRSSPPLQSLAMEIIPVLEGPSRMATHDYFRVIPSLTDLELLCTDNSSFTGLVEVLATTHDLLPNLRRLTFRTGYTVRGYSEDPEHWEHLLSMLTSRRFQSFRFIFVLSVGGHHLPEDDVLGALRRLADEGMDLYVGLDNLNFL